MYRSEEQYFEWNQMPAIAPVFSFLAFFPADAKFATCLPVGDPDAGFLEQSSSSANTGQDFHL